MRSLPREAWNPPWAGDGWRARSPGWIDFYIGGPVVMGTDPDCRPALLNPGWRADATTAEALRCTLRPLQF